MARRVDNVAYPVGLLVADLDELGGARLELGNLLVVRRLARNELGSVALGLLDGPNLLLQRVDGAALVLELVLGCSRWFESASTGAAGRTGQLSLCLPVCQRASTPPPPRLLTSLVLRENLNHFVNELDGRAALALALAHDLGVASLVGLDWAKG